MDTKTIMRKEKALWLASIIGLLGFICVLLFIGNYHFPVALGNINTTPSYSLATNASTTCGQLATGQIVIGATSSTISNASGTSMVFTLSINGVTVTSTAVATATAYTVASNFLQAIPSSTLKFSDATATDGTLIVINMTSTSWGAFITPAPAHDQLGILITPTSTFPSTQIVGTVAARNYFSATLDTSSTLANRVYLCKGTSCAIPTGLIMTTSSVPYIQNSTDQYNGAYSCISNNASSSLVNYSVAQ